ncbi:MAG: response regulator [Thermoleophilia bacterium]
MRASGFLSWTTTRYFRSGLRLLLERERGLAFAGEAATAEEALRCLERTEPDIVLLDLQMPGIGGSRPRKRIRDRRPGVRVLVLSMFDEADDVRRRSRRARTAIW